MYELREQGYCYPCRQHQKEHPGPRAVSAPWLSSGHVPPEGCSLTAGTGCGFEILCQKHQHLTEVTRDSYREFALKQDGLRPSCNSRCAERNVLLLVKETQHRRGWGSLWWRWTCSCEAVYMLHCSGHTTTSSRQHHEVNRHWGQILRWAVPVKSGQGLLRAGHTTRNQGKEHQQFSMAIINKNKTSFTFLACFA